MIFKKKLKNKNNDIAWVETFSSTAELVKVNDARPINFSSAGPGGVRTRVKPRLDWFGPDIRSWSDVEECLRVGYQPITEKLKTAPSSLEGVGKRAAFVNDVVGFAPIVPLYLQNIPTCMVRSTVKTIRNKVLNVYYENDASSWVEAADLLNAGCALLGAIMELESQGYRFNLWVTQFYQRPGEEGYMLAVKVKDANRALDIKRISFPLAHPAFLRAVGFDWYERFPNAKELSGYGQPLTVKYNRKQIQDIYEEMFNERCVVFSAQSDIHNSREEFRKVIENAGQKMG